MKHAPKQIKFIQIAAHGGSHHLSDDASCNLDCGTAQLFGLDADGNVWTYQDNATWAMLPMDIDEEEDE